MVDVKLQSGDMFFTNNFKTGAKIVMFLMTAPTCWHHLLWKITGRIEKERPRFYHAGMVLNQDEMIEQQSTVRVSDTGRIFGKDYVVWRNKKLTEQDRNKLVETAMADLGEGYGIAECIGKAIAWVTGIQWFSNAFDMKDRAICVIRVAEWYKGAVKIDFGVVDPDYLTTKAIDVYCQQHSEDWECVAIRYTEDK